MHRLLILIFVAFRVLSPEFSFIITCQSPKSVSLLNPISDEVIGTAKLTSGRNLKKVLLKDSYYEKEVSKITPYSEFLPDVRIEYDGLSIYVDFIFRTILFQEKNGDFQYLQLTEEGNQRLLEYMVTVFPDDNFLKIICKGNQIILERRKWER